MEIARNPINIKDVLDARLAFISQKHGPNAAKLADALLMSFAGNSSNDDPDKNIKIARYLIERINKGEFMFQVIREFPTFAWLNNKGKVQMLFEIVTPSIRGLDQVFITRSNVQNPIMTRDSNLATDIINSANEIHKHLGIGPTYDPSDPNHTINKEFKRLRGHLRRTCFNVAKVLAS